MDPLGPFANQKYTDDYNKFVLQNPDPQLRPLQFEPIKKFEPGPPEKSTKTKKDLEKEKQRKKQKEKEDLEKLKKPKRPFGL